MRPGWLHAGSLGALGLWVAGLVGLCVLLQPQWAGTPELAHGYLMPLVCLLLAGRSRHHGARRHPRPGGLFKTSLVLLGLGALGCTAFGGLYALGLGWEHPLACGPLTLAFVLLSLQLGLSLASMGALSLNWQSVCAASLWLLCTPLPPGTYARISVELQLVVTSAVLGSLHLLGIAAVRHGNIIELVKGSVGVEEACSGIQSLITCLFAAGLLSAWFPRAPWRRGILVLSAVPVALGLNFLRSLSLALLTAQGIDIRGAWHDWTGYVALSLATLFLIVCALALEENAPAEPNPENKANVPRQQVPGLAAFLCMLPTGLLVCLLLLQTRQTGDPGAPAPDLARLVPEKAAGWQVFTETSLGRFQQILRADAMLQREYVRFDDKGRTTLVLYVAAWKPGQANPGLVTLHTPDVCWPGAGWTEKPLAGKDPSSSLQYAQQRCFLHPAAGTQYVWYWHLHGGRPVSSLNPYRPLELLQLSLQHQLRGPQHQLFVRISSDRPWPEIAQFEIVEQLLSEAGIYGLSGMPR